MGIKLPIVKQGDDILNIICDNVIKACDNHLEEKDVIGITESLVARAQGNYVSVNDISEDIDKKFGKNQTIIIINPIYSRNRFAMILKGIAR